MYVHVHIRVFMRNTINDIWLDGERGGREDKKEGRKERSDRNKILILMS